MKKSILILALTGLSIGAMAQVKQPTFKVTFTQADINQQFSALQVVMQKLHTFDIPALKRDTLDNILTRSAQLIQLRYREALVADSIANVKPVKK